jgi:hypothetical protein
VVNKIPLGLVSFHVLRLSTVRVAPRILRIGLYVNTTLSRRTSGRSLQTFIQSSVLSGVGEVFTFSNVTHFACDCIIYTTANLLHNKYKYCATGW